MRPFLSLFHRSRKITKALYAQLSRLVAWAGLDEKTLTHIFDDCCWFSLPGGVSLKPQDDGFYLVITGALGCFASAEDESRLRHTAIFPGELCASDTGGAVIALRDSEILQLGPVALEILTARHPKLMLACLKAMARRGQAHKPLHCAGPRPKTFALVALQEGLGDDALALDMFAHLAEALHRLGLKTAIVTKADAGQSAAYFANIEAAHDVVLYCGDVPGSSWTANAIRQADRIYLLARADWPLPYHRLGQYKESVCGKPEVLLLHPARHAGRPRERLHWNSDLCDTLHHLRHRRADDIARLARSMTGQAVGLVLGGGGARGFAHIGVVKALAEAGVPFDYLGGVSMGAIVAAGLACEWSIAELESRLREVFVNTQPLSDITLPLISLVKGRKMSRLLAHHFGAVRIEELPRPFFCISTDLTIGHVHEHRAGPLWRALRSSAALPGIVPPVAWQGHLLVDGGVMNNLPVDLMAKRRVGLLIASDVTGKVDFAVRNPVSGERKFWDRMWQRVAGMPSIIDILMRTGSMGSEAQRKLVRDEADLLFEPDVASLSPLDWKRFDAAIALGYDHARAHIDRHGLPGSGIG